MSSCHNLQRALCSSISVQSSQFLSSISHSTCDLGPPQTIYEVPATRQQVQDIINHCNDAPVEDMLEDQCRVVGHSHKGVAFVLAQTKANLPGHARPLAHPLCTVDSNLQYWTLLMEHDKVQGFNESLPEDVDPSLWVNATLKYNEPNQMKVLYQVSALKKLNPLLFV